MKNKLISVLLVAAMTITMAGCGSSSSDKVTGTEKATTSAASKESASSGDKATITMTWRDEGTKSSPLSSDIGKKISDFREESLSAKLATAKRNPVGILAILNRHYGWNLPGVSREQQNRKQALTASDLPQLGGANSQNIKALSSDNMVDNAK